jgi:high affinity Mn2+ porin
MAAAAFGGAFLWALPAWAGTDDSLTAAPEQGTAAKEAGTPEQRWNLHVQNTDIVEGDLSFPAKYSGPYSLGPGGEVDETVSVDMTLGLRLWQGAEFHLDGIYYQGFGLSDAHGLAGVNNNEAFRVGTHHGNVNFTRVFVRQTFGLGGEQEDVVDDQLHLAGKVDVSRVTATVGRFSAKDIFDNNAYANDPRTQFMNWVLCANGAWDYPADSLGYMSGGVIELNQKQWATRFGFFQVPRVLNGEALDEHFAEAWQMVSETERRFSIYEHPGVIRFLAFLSHTHQGSFGDALESSVRPAVTDDSGYRYKYGFGLNAEQEVIKDVGVFARLSWNDGQTEEWQFTDADRAASAGVSIKGSFWHRPDDVLGIAGAINGLSSNHAKYLAAGGLGIDTGDGALTYGTERILETYYDAQIYKGVHVAFDYQFVSNPAYNQDRGPVSVFSGRLHWEF